MVETTAFGRSTELVIFDCDGVLVDSEPIANDVLMRLAEPYGLSLTRDEANALFTGHKLARNIADIERLLDRSLPSNFDDLFRQAERAEFENELKPIEGVAAAIDQIEMPKCVASSGPREKIELSLRLTGLLSRFEGRIFSAYEVGAWKPEPALFLQAATTLQAEPSACTVIEDSLPGIEAGMAAGMRVLAFAPDDNTRSTCADWGVTTFRHMAELPALLR